MSYSSRVMRRLRSDPEDAFVELAISRGKSTRLKVTEDPQYGECIYRIYSGAGGQFETVGCDIPRPPRPCTSACRAISSAHLHSNCWP